MVAQREDDGEGAKEEGMAYLWSDKARPAVCLRAAAAAAFQAEAGGDVPGAAVGPLRCLDFAL